MNQHRKGLLWPKPSGGGRSSWYCIVRFYFRIDLHFWHGVPFSYPLLQWQPIGRPGHSAMLLLQSWRGRSSEGPFRITTEMQLLQTNVLMFNL